MLKQIINRRAALAARTRFALIAALGLGATLITAGGFAADAPEGGRAAEHFAPSAFWVFPFVALLLGVAVLPLVPRVNEWWHHNSSKLTYALVLSAVTLGYYALRGHAFHESAPGAASAWGVFHHAILGDYIPFIVLLFSLYTISGGILVETTMIPTPMRNGLFMLCGAALASFIGTTGASMLFIRPLLQINRRRRFKSHTVVFFIFLVSNIGGALLPIGDPPLFLGYLYGVPFLWTLRLIPHWLVAALIVTAIYVVLDTVKFRREDEREAILASHTPLRVGLEGKINLLLLGAVILAVATLSPGRAFPGTGRIVPNIYLREMIQLALAGLSVMLTAKSIREANNFTFGAIAEVACLFVGIFITMQTPIEILQAKGAALGLHTPAHFFWASGMLSSVLDNAPTYVVFFQTAGSLENAGAVLNGVTTASGVVPIKLLIAISLGSVFMGANTYIGNGPNFMVKSIAEQYHVKMPSFFGYMAYSGAVLIPTFLLLTLIYF